MISIGIAVLIGVGIVLASVGMLQLRRSVDRNRVLARRGFSLHGVGLIVLLLGVLALQLSSSIADRDQQPYVVEAVLLLSVVLVVSAGALMEISTVPRTRWPTSILPHRASSDRRLKSSSPPVPSSLFRL